MRANVIHRPARQRAREARPDRKSNRARARSALELRALQGFRTVFGSARTHDAEVRRAAGISGSQLWALSEITRGSGMSVSGLAERMALHQTTTSNLVNALAQRRLIRRVRDAADQRVVHLHVTTEGKRSLLGAPGPYTGLLLEALRRLDADQLEALWRGLHVLIGVMTTTAATAAGETLLGE
jgi:DNA-binding MarR family transcriptional regulator